MKNRSNCWVIAAVGMSLVACGKKEEVQAPAEPVAVAPPAQVVAPAPAPTAPPVAVKVAALSPEQRAAKLGFVQYLAPDTEMVMAFHNGMKSAERFKSSKLWQLVAEATHMNPAAEATAEPEEATGPRLLLGTEFTLALGKSAGAQGANLLTAYRRMGYFQIRMLAKAFAAAAKSGDFDSMDQAFAEQYGQELFKELLADPESGTALVDRLNLPPLYLAFRTSAGQREAATQQLATLVTNLGLMGSEMVEPVEIETAGQKFAGQKLSGAKISESMAQNREQIEKTLDPAIVDKLLAAIAKKDLVMVSGTLGDYSILFLGSSVEELKLVTAPGQSLLASDSLAFTDAYASKDLAAVIYGQKGAMDQLMAAAGGLADMAGALREGLAGSEGLGDTRDLEALLRLVGERESALRKLVTNDSLGMTAFFEDGLKIESYGGSDNGAVDWKSPNKLASLGDAPDVVMFANMTTEAAYDEKARAYMEALMETAYAVTMKVAEVKIDNEKMARFKDMAQKFDSKFRTDVVALWETLSGDFDGNLGHERACIVDLSGSVPAIPGIPQAVVDAGKFPRISVLAPVTDRAKLAASWQKINASATTILAKISAMTKQEIPMQKPTSSDKDGFTTWFFSMPFFNDDFMPSVTVGDQWFAASTSKNQALDLLRLATKGGPTRTGLYVTLNFKAMQKFSQETLKVLDQNAPAIFGETIPSNRMENAGKLAEAMQDMDKLTIHARREGGVLRSSVHFKTR